MISARCGDGAHWGEKFSRTTKLEVQQWQMLCMLIDHYYGMSRAPKTSPFWSVEDGRAHPPVAALCTRYQEEYLILWSPASVESASVEIDSDIDSDIYNSQFFGGRETSSLPALGDVVRVASKVDAELPKKSSVTRKCASYSSSNCVCGAYAEPS